MPITAVGLLTTVIECVVEFVFPNASVTVSCTV